MGYEKQPPERVKLSGGLHEIGELNLDVFAIAEQFGGRKALYDCMVLVGGYDYLSKSTLDKWFDRRRIPLHWLLTIIEVSKKLDAEIDPYAFAIPPEFERIDDCPPQAREKYIRKYGRTLGIKLEGE